MCCSKVSVELYMTPRLHTNVDGSMTTYPRVAEVMEIGFFEWTLICGLSPFNFSRFLSIHDCTLATQSSGSDGLVRFML